MEKAPGDHGPRVDPEDLRRIEPLVAFVDAALGETQKAESHPLATLLGNWAEGNIRNLVEISDNLLLASYCPGFGRMSRDLGSTDPIRWQAILKEIQVLGELARSGFEVSIVPEGRKRSHDIDATIEDNSVHIEVTNMGMSAVERRSWEETESLNWNLEDLGGVSVDLRFHKSLSSPRRKEMMEEVLEIIERVREGKTGFRESFTEVGVFSVTVEKGEKPESGSMNIRGPDIDRNELGRLSYRIKEKAKQLPKNEPGILVIFDPSLSGIHLVSPDYSGVVANIEEAVFEFPFLSGLLLIIEYNDSQASDLSLARGHWFAWRRKGHGWAVEDRIFIQNRYSVTGPEKRFLAAFGWPPNLDRR